MNGYVQPIAIAGGAGWHALAGSRYLSWAHALRRHGQDLVAAEALAPALVGRISARRDDLCGLTLDRPRVMGILNITPDSFSDGGEHGSFETALAHARAIAPECDIIDIGGESTRPGSRGVSVDEEITRTAPVIRALRAEGMTTPVSIDTRKAAVAEAALDAGADMLNDITALRYDPKMAPLIAERGVPVCLMHSVADPETMQAHARYGDVVDEVLAHLRERIDAAGEAGIPPGRILVDPGIGFGKTTAHNLRLVREITSFHALGVGVILGASRKNFIGVIGGAPAGPGRMPGSLAMALAGVAAGVQVLRVHDVSETRQALSLWEAMAGGGKDA